MTDDTSDTREDYAEAVELLREAGFEIHREELRADRGDPEFKMALWLERGGGG